MYKSLSFVVLFLLSMTGFSAPVSANLMLESYASGTATSGNIGGYAMSDFAASTRADAGRHGFVERTSSVFLPELSGDSLSFVDKNGNSMSLSRRLVGGVNWWKNGEPNSYDIFTTDENLITILLPENTFAFSFNVGSSLGSTGNNAWITATESDGSGISSKHRFNVSRNNSPGFGIYSVNAGGSSCSSLTSITIEPEYWGVGNFSINRGACVGGSSSVPEPSSLALLALGVISFGMARHKKQLSV